MRLVDVLTPDRIIFCDDISSKKKALELASKVAVKTLPDIDEDDVYEGLLSRERLGSTGIGFGIAIPHCRLAKLRETVAVILRLDHGIDFDTTDKVPVDIILVLLAPEDSSEEHLKLLADIAEHFSQNNFRNLVRETRDPHEFYKIATEYD